MDKAMCLCHFQVNAFCSSTAHWGKKTPHPYHKSFLVIWAELIGGLSLWKKLAT